MGRRLNSWPLANWGDMYKVCDFDNLINCFVSLFITNTIKLKRQEWKLPSCYRRDFCSCTEYVTFFILQSVKQEITLFKVTKFRTLLDEVMNCFIETVCVISRNTVLKASIQCSPRASFLFHSVLLLVSPECYHLLKPKPVTEYSARSLCRAVRDFKWQSVRSHCPRLPWLYLRNDGRSHHSMLLRRLLS